MADLQIVLRYAHMFDPGYMPVTGCDATVSWGGPDFAFRNSTDYPIKITTSYNDETNQLTITLLGTKTDDHYVEMTNQFLSYSERKTVYQESESVTPGTTEVEQYGHNGYAVQSYRNVFAGRRQRKRPAKAGLFFLRIILSVGLRWGSASMPSWPAPGRTPRR